MKTIKSTAHTSFREKGSKFIGYLFAANNVQQFEKKHEQFKSKYPDATHHCYAWRINPNKTEEFAQDDGEPSGTAGLPILNKLKSFKMINCGCVVIRYYGGTKLGKSGLIEAYGRSAQLCLEKSVLVQLIPTTNFEITYPYSRQSEIDQLKNTYDLKEVNARYLEKVTLEIACRSEQADDFWNALQEREHHEIESEKKGDSFVTMHQ